KDLTVIEGLVKALFAKLLQTSKSGNKVNPTTENLYQKFRQLLSQDKKRSNKVSYYAELLKTSPQNLNASCRKENNQSAAEVLAGYIISQAKRLLLYTDLTVLEIAFDLGFRDNSHFTKYFKR